MLKWLKEFLNFIATAIRLLHFGLFVIAAETVEADENATDEEKAKASARRDAMNAKADKVLGI